LRIFKIPEILKNIFPDIIWKINNYTQVHNKIVYLTFDDGPAPEITEYVLELLNIYNAKATFFVVGNNVIKYPEIFNKIIENKHSIGNHTFNHLNGWKTQNEIYFEDIIRCNELINSNLFRPPHGKLKISQYNHLKNHYKIILWSIISYDFDEKLSWKECFSNVIKHIEPGSIIVFHDSLKASKRLLFLLPELLKLLSEMEYQFDKIVF